MKKGFTLVELSIVLVIIGLLIGGTLAAQSMINTAKIQGVVRQLQQYDVAVANFQTKFGQLPGDSNLFSGGNNNGLVEYGNEVFNFWSDLSLGTGLQNSQGTSYVLFNGFANPNTVSDCPRFNISQSSAGQPCLYVLQANYGYGAGQKNYYNYVESTGGVLSASTNTLVIKPADALAIDQKIDDGMPHSGKMYSEAHNGGASNECIDAAIPPAYEVKWATYNCSMFFEIGATGVNVNN